MPTLRLYHANPACPDGSHDVRAPGGYEWWYFDAEDPRTDTRIVANFLHGFSFHPEYLRRYSRYRSRPTRHLPPLPGEYPCAYFAVYRGGRVLHQFMTQYAPDALVASADRAQLTLGPNSLDDGSGLNIRLSGTPGRVTPTGPKLPADRSLDGEFAFAPRLTSPAHERIFLSQRLSGAEHHWVIANPLCDVTGSIRCCGETIEFAGRGYHDHNYGTAPIGPGLKRWLWGRILLEDSAYTFHFARARDRALPDEIHLIHADSTGMRELPIQRAQADWSGISAYLLRYPRNAAFDDVLKLTNPRVIDTTPFCLRLIYDARLGDRAGTAFCGIAYPHRLRWPVLGRMIGMSIHASEPQTPMTKFQ